MAPVIATRVPIKLQTWCLMRRAVAFYSTRTNPHQPDKPITKLARLRKKTGFALSNCRKALEVNDHNYDLALNWMREQAQAEGWAKATKLQDRSTSQGLIALFVDSHYGSIIEVNCETDFVVRNKIFRDFVNTSLLDCRRFYKQSLAASHTDYVKKYVSSKELENVLWRGGTPDKTLADLSALTIGRVGENIRLRRALCVRVPDDCFLHYYMHSQDKMGSQDHTLVGRHAAMIAVRPVHGTTTTAGSAMNVGRHVCQHIVAMAPTSVGDAMEWGRERDERLERRRKLIEKREEEEEKEREDEEQGENEVEEGENEVEEEAVESEETKIADTREENERRLIFQSYLLDEDLQVGDVLEQHNLEVIDFIRFGCGDPDVTED